MSIPHRPEVAALAQHVGRTPRTPGDLPGPKRTGREGALRLTCCVGRLAGENAARQAAPPSTSKLASTPNGARQVGCWGTLWLERWRFVHLDLGHRALPVGPPSLSPPARAEDDTLTTTPSITSSTRATLFI